MFRRPPLLILIMGVAGSGKTRLSRTLLEHISATYLDKDELFEAFFPGRREGGDYDRLRPALYRALYNLARSNLRAGNSVLLDAPHMKEARSADWWRSMEELAAASGAGLAAIRCSCDERTLRRRLEARGERRDRSKLERWADFLREQPIRGALPFEALEVDTGEEGLDEVVGRVLEYLGRRVTGGS